MSHFNGAMRKWGMPPRCRSETGSKRALPFTHTAVRGIPATHYILCPRQWRASPLSEFGQLFGGDLSCVLGVPSGLRKYMETRNNPGSEPGLLPRWNEALYWPPWDPSPVSATSCSTSESP